MNGQTTKVLMFHLGNRFDISSSASPVSLDVIFG